MNDREDNKPTPKNNKRAWVKKVKLMD